MARIVAYVPEAFESIWRNRTRSLLSILGMVIGIASVIGVLGLSQAGANGMKATIASGGDPGYIVIPDQSQDNPALATMYYRDVALLQSYVPSIKEAIPLYVSRTYRITVLDNNGAVASPERVINYTNCNVAGEFHFDFVRNS